jgi:hypothetical protein
MQEAVNLYAGITLISADDKTPKRMRIGNYWKEEINGKYSKCVSIERYNKRQSKGL